MREYKVKAANGSTDRTGLFKAMNVLSKHGCLVELTLKTVRYRVKTCNGTNEVCFTKRELRQYTLCGAVCLV
jgi:hypothetical protein